MALTRIAGAVLLALALAHSGVAQELKSGSEAFTPNVGQPGKDVIWVPTPGALITRMLTMAKVTPGDHVIDLGSGDGRIAIAAGKEFGATALGVEYNADMVALSQRSAREAGVADKVQFVKGDIFATDFGKATVITMYLLPLTGLLASLRAWVMVLAVVVTVVTGLDYVVRALHLRRTSERAEMKRERRRARGRS